MEIIIVFDDYDDDDEDDVEEELEDFYFVCFSMICNCIEICEEVQEFLGDYFCIIYCN